ncbi:YoaK family protein [Peptoniphilus olsenii]|uniref:YoaK family protein n=1 Tax=Peptoniphilus olsenii TaxID=411570 RepID=UPI003F499632
MIFLRLDNYENLHETFPVVVFLTLAGGFQDAYSYIMRGKVFANAQTGNIVLLFKNIVDLNLSEIIKYIIPLLAFMLGVHIAVRYENFHSYSNMKWRQMILLFEIIFMISVAFIPSKLDNMANAILSFVCAMQVYSFKKIYGLTFATTMCIGNLRSATENLSRYQITKDTKYLDASKKYYVVILIFGIGAGLGYLFSKIFKLKSILIAAIFLLISLIIMFFDNEN